METFDLNDFTRTTVDGQFSWVASVDFTVNVEHDTVNEPLETFRVVLAFVGPSQPYLLRGDMTADGPPRTTLPRWWTCGR